MNPISFSTETKKKVYTFFVEVLKTREEPLYYETIRGHVSQEPNDVQLFLKKQCKGEELLEYFKKRKNYFIVDRHGYVSLKEKVYKKYKLSADDDSGHKTERDKKNDGTRKKVTSSKTATAQFKLINNKLSNSAIFTTAATAEKRVKYSSSSSSSSSDDNIEDIVVDYFIYMMQHNSVKLNYHELRMESLPKNVQKYLKKTYVKDKIKMFFLSHCEFFSIDDDGFVNLKFGNTAIQPEALDEQLDDPQETANSVFCKKVFLSESSSLTGDQANPILNKKKRKKRKKKCNDGEVYCFTDKEEANTVQYFVNILEKKHGGPVSFDSIKGHLAQASPQVFLYIKPYFKGSKFKQFFTFYPKIFVLNSKNEVSLTKYYMSQLVETEILVDDFPESNSEIPSEMFVDDSPESNSEMLFNDSPESNGKIPGDIQLSPKNIKSSVGEFGHNIQNATLYAALPMDKQGNNGTCVMEKDIVFDVEQMAFFFSEKCPSLKGDMSGNQMISNEQSFSSVAKPPIENQKINKLNSSEIDSCRIAKINVDNSSDDQIINDQRVSSVLKPLLIVNQKINEQNITEIDSSSSILNKPKVCSLKTADTSAHNEKQINPNVCPVLEELNDENEKCHLDSSVIELQTNTSKALFPASSNNNVCSVFQSLSPQKTNVKRNILSAKEKHEIVEHNDELPRNIKDQIAVFICTVDLFCLEQLEIRKRHDKYLEVEAVKFFVQVLSLEPLTLISLKGKLKVAPSKISSYIKEKYSGDKFSLFFVEHTEFQFFHTCEGHESKDSNIGPLFWGLSKELVGVEDISSVDYILKSTNDTDLNLDKLYFNNDYFMLYSFVYATLFTFVSFIQRKQNVTFKRLDGILSQFNLEEKIFVESFDEQTVAEKIRSYLLHFPHLVSVEENNINANENALKFLEALLDSMLVGKISALINDETVEVKTLADELRKFPFFNKHLLKGDALKNLGYFILTHQDRFKVIGEDKIQNNNLVDDSEIILNLRKTSSDVILMVLRNKENIKYSELPSILADFDQEMVEIMTLKRSIVLLEVLDRQNFICKDGKVFLNNPCATEANDCKLLESNDIFEDIDTSLESEISNGAKLDSFKAEVRTSEHFHFPNGKYSENYECNNAIIANDGDFLSKNKSVSESKNSNIISLAVTAENMMDQEKSHNDSMDGSMLVVNHEVNDVYAMTDDQRNNQDFNSPSETSCVVGSVELSSCQAGNGNGTNNVTDIDSSLEKNEFTATTTRKNNSHLDSCNILHYDINNELTQINDVFDMSAENHLGAFKTEARFVCRYTKDSTDLRNGTFNTHKNQISSCNSKENKIHKQSEILLASRDPESSEKTTVDKDQKIKKEFEEKITEQHSYRPTDSMGKQNVIVNDQLPVDQDNSIKLDALSTIIYDRKASTQLNVCHTFSPTHARFICRNEEPTNGIIHYISEPECIDISTQNKSPEKMDKYCRQNEDNETFVSNNSFFNESSKPVNNSSGSVFNSNSTTTFNVGCHVNKTRNTEPNTEEHLAEFIDSCHSKISSNLAVQNGIEVVLPEFEHSNSEADSNTPSESNTETISLKFKEKNHCIGRTVVHSEIGMDENTDVNDSQEYLPEENCDVLKNLQHHTSTPISSPPDINTSDRDTFSINIRRKLNLLAAIPNAIGLEVPITSINSLTTDSLVSAGGEGQCDKNDDEFKLCSLFDNNNAKGKIVESIKNNCSQGVHIDDFQPSDTHLFPQAPESIDSSKNKCISSDSVAHWLFPSGDGNLNQESLICVACITLVSENTCLAQTNYMGQKKIVYFSNSVVRCSEHDNCKKFLDLLTVGKTVLCHIVPTSICDNILLAFLVTNNVKCDVMTVENDGGLPQTAATHKELQEFDKNNNNECSEDLPKCEYLASYNDNFSFLINGNCEKSDSGKVDVSSVRSLNNTGVGQEVTEAADVNSDQVCSFSQHTELTVETCDVECQTYSTGAILIKHFYCD